MNPGRNPIDHEYDRRLPFEILSAIFDEVENIRDLLNTRTASRALCAAATPRAFCVLSVIGNEESIDNIRRLFDVPESSYCGPCEGNRFWQPKVRLEAKVWYVLSPLNP